MPPFCLVLRARAAFIGGPLTGRWTRGAAALLAALAAGAAQAIVNVEGLRAAAPEGFAGRLDLALNGASGNSEKLGLALGTRLQWRRGHATDLAILDYAYGESRGVRDTDKTFLHARRTVEVGARRAAEGFVQLEANEFTRLSSRSLVGGGLRLALAAREERAAYLGVGAFYVREILEARPGLTDRGTDTLWRANLYLALNGAASGSVRLLSTTYLQPALEDARDFRALEEAALEVKLADDLDFRVSLEIAHDSRPPQTVDKTDIGYRTSIIYRF